MAHHKRKAAYLPQRVQHHPRMTNTRFFLHTNKVLRLHPRLPIITWLPGRLCYASSLTYVLCCLSIIINWLFLANCQQLAIEKSKVHTSSSWMFAQKQKGLGLVLLVHLHKLVVYLFWKMEVICLVLFLKGFHYNWSSKKPLGVIFLGHLPTPAAAVQW